MPFKAFRKRRPKKTTLSALHRALLLLCAVTLIAGGAYTAHWYLNRNQVRKEAELYSQMYAPEKTAVPTPQASPEPPLPEATLGADMPEIIDEPIPTPDNDTLVLSLETPPPVQESFSALLSLNPETIGFLRVSDLISAPVVQRKNDNEYYLDHSFSGEEAKEGALFLDGLNQLAPEDDCLIVYGHNMHDGTMFGNLRQYQNLEYFRSCPPVAFDTIYENRVYVPFATFTASMDSSDADYFDVRRFLMSDSEFDAFVAQLKSRSDHAVPVDVQSGDRLLLLVTCDYSANDGRFIVALRQLRPDETVADAQAMIARAH